MVKRSGGECASREQLMAAAGIFTEEVPQHTGSPVDAANNTAQLQNYIRAVALIHCSTAPNSSHPSAEHAHGLQPCNQSKLVNSPA
jgi:hypothetical protein